MHSSRVIRPARVLPDAFQVIVPENLSAACAAGSAPEIDDRESAEERERSLRRSLQELEGRLEEREESHAREIREMEARSAESAEEQIADAVGRFTSMVDDFTAQRADLLKSSEEGVVRLAVAIARRIVGDAIEVNEEIVLGTVRRALKHVQEKESLVIRVNPEDLRIVRDHRSEWLSIVEGSGSLEVEEDERIRRGGCLVETEAGNVEAQIDKQIQNVEKVLVERVR